MSSRLATILMFIAWLLYGAMPAIGMPSMMPADEGMAMSGMSMAGMNGMAQNQSMDGAMQMHDHSAMALPAHAKSMASATTNATTGAYAETSMAASASEPCCPHGGKLCVSAFCAACLTVLPETSFGDGRTDLRAYPKPGLQASLIASAWAPPTPPPRA